MFNFNRLVYLISYVIISFSCLSPLVVNAYMPPLGIPNPFIDPNISRPQRPSNWDHEIPGYYYVDFEKGTDSGRTYGYPAAPKKTLPRPIPPGSFIELHGRYNSGQGGVIHFEGYGTSDQWQPNACGPVWIVGANENSMPLVGPLKTVVYGKYIFIENIKFSRLQIGSPAIGFKAEHILVRNSVMRGDAKSRWNGITISGSNDAPLYDIIIFKNIIYNYGDINTSQDQDACGIYVSAYTGYVWILKNKVYECSGSGIFAGGQWNENPKNTHHIFIGRNEVYNVRQSGIWVKNGEDIIFSQNYVHDIIDTSWSPSKGLGAQYGPVRLWILFNRVERVRYGVRIASTSENRHTQIAIIGNVISDAHHIYGSYTGGSWGDAGIHIAGGDEVYIINNTVFNSDAGINISGFKKYYLVNNIIANITEKAGNHIYVENALQSTIISNCILFQIDNKVRIKWGSRLYSENIQNINSHISNIIISDPLLKSDLSLKPSSPAIDNGINPQQLDLNIFDRFFSLYDINITVDFNGVVRPQGNAWDIGAFEFKYDNQNDNNDSIPPESPKKLRVKIY